MIMNHNFKKSGCKKQNKSNSHPMSAWLYGKKAFLENIDSNVKYCNFSGEKFHNIYQKALKQFYCLNNSTFRNLS